MKKSIVQFRRMRGVSYALHAMLLCAMLAGCNVGPKYHPPTMTAPPAFKESPAQFKETDGWTVAQPQDAALRGKWWEIYNEPELNALEEQLNINNQNIRQSFENFMEARALVREARCAVFPHGEHWSFVYAVAESSNLLALQPHLAQRVQRQAIPGVLASG